MNRDEFEAALAVELARYYPAGAEAIEASLKRMRDGDSYADKSVTGAGMAWAARYAWWAWRESREADREDAERYRWLCDGQGYFLEEAGINDGKAEADAAIDQAMAEDRKP